MRNLLERFSRLLILAVLGLGLLVALAFVVALVLLLLVVAFGVHLP